MEAMISVWVIKFKFKFIKHWTHPFTTKRNSGKHQHSESITARI